MTRVSIVIPCYNDGAYLREAVASALSQTHLDTEVIVVDDGSTDRETVRTLDDLPTGRLRVLRQKNGGVSAARNAGIATAEGAYILPLDADDCLGPTYAANAAVVLDQRPEVGLVGSYTQLFGRRNAVERPPVPHAVDWLLANRLPVSSVFRRSSWEACGGYADDLWWGEDWHLWVKLVALECVVDVLPEVGLHYRQRAGQVTTRAGWEIQERARMRVLQDGLPIMTRYPERSAAALGRQLNLLQAMRERRVERLRSRLVSLAKPLRR